MNLVIDTSVIIAVVTHEPHRERLIALTRGADMIAPPSVRWEIGNAFSAMFKRRRISRQQALQALAACSRIPLRYVGVELEESLVIADEWNLYAYDAYLLRCAVKYRAPLLSLDQDLLRVATRMGVTVIEVF